MTRSLRSGMVRLLVLALGGAAACSTYPTLKPVAVDCAAEDPYEFQLFEPYEMVGVGNLWMSPEPPLANLSVAVEAIPEGQRCGSSAALVLRSMNANDWGALFGVNNFGPRDESAYEGVSFWARGPGNTGKSFTVTLDDANTTVPSAAVPTNCKDYGADAGVPSPGGYDSTGQPITGGVTVVAQPDACGNGYSAIIVVTADWRLYTVPFSQFRQTATPNRVPNSALMETGTSPGTALLTKRLINMQFRMPKESAMELWIDDLGFYRKKGLAAGADGGIQ